MGNSKSKPILYRGAFDLFPQLPAELQRQIWAIAAFDWASVHLMYMTSPLLHSEKTIYMLRIQPTCGPCTCRPTDSCIQRPDDGGPHGNWRFELPPMLVVSSEARVVMYDTLIWSCRPDEPVPKGENICVYILEDVQSRNDYHTPKYYGLRIQDMRPPGLEKRMKEEKERLAEMQAELSELVALGLTMSTWPRHIPIEGLDFGNVVFKRKKPEGWFRLPLGYDVAYYKVEQGGIWINELHRLSTRRRAI